MPEGEMQENINIFPEATVIKDKGPRNFKDRFWDFYYNAIPFFSVNLAWFVMSLPVVTIFPALGGLYHAVLALNQDNLANWGTVWEGFKKHWQISFKWGSLVLFGNLILAANIWFYLSLDQDWAIFALVASILLLLIWVAINQFSFPVLLLQEEKKVFLAIRNGYVIVLRRPQAALKVILFTLLIAVVSTLLPPLWIFISMALIVHIRTRTVLNTLKKIREEDAQRDAIKAHREGKAVSEDNEET